MDRVQPGHSDASATSSTPEAAASVNYRLAVAADAAAVASLIGTTWAKHFGYSVSPSDLETYLATNLAPATIEAEIVDPAMTFYVAETAGAAEAGENSAPAVIGVAHLVAGTAEPCLTLPRPIELRRIYVDSAHHGRGVAERLIAGAQAIARGRGAQSMWLGVWNQNPRAQRFYEKQGFKSVGEHSFVVGESIRRDWVMETSL